MSCMTSHVHDMTRDSRPRNSDYPPPKTHWCRISCLCHAFYSLSCHAWQVMNMTWFVTRDPDIRIPRPRKPPGTDYHVSAMHFIVCHVMHDKSCPWHDSWLETSKFGFPAPENPRVPNIPPLQRYLSPTLDSFHKVQFLNLAVFVRQITQPEPRQLETSGLRHFVANSSGTETFFLLSVLMGVTAEIQPLKHTLPKLF
jgi:hypothetical protein